MNSNPIKPGLQTIKAKTVNNSARSPRRLIGFREWCEKVYEPSKRMREERWALLNQHHFNKDQGTVHGQR